MEDEGRGAMQKPITDERHWGYTLVFWVLIFISLNLCSNSMLLRSQEKLNAGDVVGATILHSLDIQYSFDFPLAATFIKLGDCYAQLGHLELALVNYEKALEVARSIYGNAEDKRFCDIYFNSAKAYNDNNKHKEAVILYGKTIGLDQQFPNAKNLCAWILATSHDPALRDARRAIKLAKLECTNSGWMNPDHLATYAAAQAASRNFSEAIKWQLAAIKLEEEEEVLETLGQHLQLYQGSVPYIQKQAQSSSISANGSKYKREIEGIVRRYFEAARGNSWHIISDMTHPDSLEISKEGFLAVVALGAKGGKAEYRVDWRGEILRIFNVKTITEIKPLAGVEFANARVVHLSSRYINSGYFRPSGGGGLIFDNSSITKEGEITIANLKHIDHREGKEMVNYTTLFLKEHAGEIKILTTLSAGKLLPDLGGLYLGVNRPEVFHLAVLDRVKEANSLDDPNNVANTLKALGILCQFQQDYANAEDFFELSLAINESEYGTGHLVVRHSLYNLLYFYLSQKDHAKAKKIKQRINHALCMRHLSIMEKKYNPDHPKVVSTLNALAFSYLVQREYAKAEPLLKRSLAIRENTYGPDHIKVERSLNNLSQLYSAQGDHAKAVAIKQRADQIFKKRLGELKAVLRAP